MAKRDFTEYTVHSETQANQSEKLIKMFLHLVEEELLEDKSIELILDAGCGDGEVTEYLDKILLNEINPENYKIVGIDSSRKRIRKAKKNHNEPNINYIRSDVTNFSSSQKFDAIFSNAALHWIKDQNKLYENFNNLLRHKGVLAVHQGAEGSYIELHNIALKTAKELGLRINEKKTPPAYISPDHVRNLLDRNNFRLVDLEPLEYPMESKQIVRDFAEASLSEYFSNLKRDQIKQYKRSFVKNGLNYIESGGQVTARRIYYTAIKE